MDEEDAKIADSMRVMGGSFVSALGELAWRADPINLKKIKEAWPEYWDAYREIACTKKDINIQ